jgi:hypothetical protein
VGQCRWNSEQWIKRRHQRRVQTRVRGSISTRRKRTTSPAALVTRANNGPDSKDGTDNHSAFRVWSCGLDKLVSLFAEQQLYVAEAIRLCSKSTVSD